MMSITVKYEFEGPLNNIRFWLEMVVNGRTQQSRGILIEKFPGQDTPDMRKRARQITENAQRRINLVTEPKAAAALLVEVVQAEVEFLRAADSFKE